MNSLPRISLLLCLFCVLFAPLTLGAQEKLFPGQTSFISSPEAFAVGDLNGDGRSVVVVATSDNSASIKILYGTSIGTLSQGNSYSASGYPNKIIIADLDGDGKPEIITTNQSYNTISIFRNMGFGQFAPKVDYFSPA